MKTPIRILLDAIFGLLAMALASASIETHAAISFAPEQRFSTPAGPISVTTADINNDNIVDVLVANLNDPANGVAVLMNSTSQNSTTVQLAPWVSFMPIGNGAGDADYALTTADLNADGRLDILVADSNANQIALLLNTTGIGAATPAFAPPYAHPSTGPTGNEKPRSVVAADIDGDGKPDVIASDTAIGKVAILLNTTAQNATTATTAPYQLFTTGTGTINTIPRCIAADLNNDDKPDIACVNRGENTASVLVNHSTPGVLSLTTQPALATGASPSGVAVADINNDGWPDIIVVDSVDNTVSVFINTTIAVGANPTFAARIFFPSGAVNPSSSYFVMTADIDGDGKPDIVVSNGNPGVAVLVNTTPAGTLAPTFAAAQSFSVGVTTYAVFSVTAADINRDGKIDLIAPNHGDNTVSVLLNTSPSDLIFANGFEP